MTNDLQQARAEAAERAIRGDTLLCHMDGSAVPFQKIAVAALAAADALLPTEEKP